MSGAPENYSGDTILDSPDQAKPILPIQGGGARPRLDEQGDPIKGANGKTVMTNNSVESVETENRRLPYNAEQRDSPIKPAKLVKLEKGFRVRLPEESIKQEIIDLDFTPEEERLFKDYLKFDKAFVERYISNSDQSKQDFYDFWKLFVEKDGTDGYTLMTKSEGKKLQNYMEDIVYAHRDYLIQSALRLLRKQDNPEHFEDIMKPESKEGFIFAEVKPRVVPVEPELSKEDEEDEDDEDYEDDDAEGTEDEDEEDEDEDEDEEEEEDAEDKIKNILTHIHKKIITVSSSDIPEVKVIKLLDYLIQEFEYDEADKDTAISLLGEYLGCKKSPRGKISCRLDISQDYDKVTCKTFLDTFNDKFNLSKIAKMDYHEDTEVLKWLIENMYLVSIGKTTAEYREILTSRLVYFYNRFIGDLVGRITAVLQYITPGITYKKYIEREKLPELPEALQPKKKK
jgi:hypothetical protein